MIGVRGTLVDGYGADNRLTGGRWYKKGLITIPSGQNLSDLIVGTISSGTLNLKEINVRGGPFERFSLTSF